MKRKVTPLTQADAMRILYKHFKRDDAKCVETYAKLEKRCIVEHKNNKGQHTSLAYAKRLLAHYKTKGTIKDKPKYCKTMGELLEKLAG